MSNSSQHTVLSTALSSDTITISLPDSDNMLSYISTDSMNNMLSYISTDTITLSGGSTAYNITTGAVDSNYISSWELPQEWVNAFPDWEKVEDMCKHYPGLEIALRNFKTVYALVKDDYDTPNAQD